MDNRGLVQYAARIDCVAASIPGRSHVKEDGRLEDDLFREFRDNGWESFEISNRERTLFLLHEYDLEAQLLAIKDLVRRNRQSDEGLAAEIEALDAEIRKSTDEHVYHLQDCWIDRIHDSVFQDAAHSMSAVGMLAPFIESLFVAVFNGLRKDQDGPPVSLTGKRRRGQEGIVERIKHHSVSTGLEPFLPDGYAETLSALFAYRNKMFHNGFEWPVEERHKFSEQMQKIGWPPEWFKKSTSGDQPWIFYMTAEFIQHCLDTVDEVLEGVGAYLTQHE